MFNKERIDYLVKVVENDIDQCLYDGANLLLAHDGQIVLNKSLGFANRDSGLLLGLDHVFNVFSVAKAVTAIAVFIQIERGHLSLGQPIAEIIPEFANKGKEQITIHHLLTHMSGLSADLPKVPFGELGNLQAVVQAICSEELVFVPGKEVLCSSGMGFMLLGEAVRRTCSKKRSFRAFVQEEILDPLHMKDTSIGLRADLETRRVPVHFSANCEGMFPTEMIELADIQLTSSSEIPSGFGVFSTVQDFFILAEMVRRKGEYGGRRILSRAMIELATTNQTANLPDHIWDPILKMRGWQPIPAFFGLAFYLRGQGIFPHAFGTLAAPQTFGSLGLGSTMYWVDPVRNNTFVCFTSGLMEESRSVERFQRLSDLVVAAYE